MTWGEIKLTTLQKMFSSDGTKIDTNDESIKEYLYSMPAAANEAIRMLVTAGIPVRNNALVTKQKGKPLVVDVSLENGDFWRMPGAEVYKIADDDVYAYDGCELLAGRYLKFPQEAEGEFEYYYDAMPPAVSQDTPDDTEINIAPEAVVLVPLYMAGELYKDDDLSTATYYRNEFEAGLALLKKPVVGVSKFTSNTGWW